MCRKLLQFSLYIFSGENKQTLTFKISLIKFLNWIESTWTELYWIYHYIYWFILSQAIRAEQLIEIAIWLSALCKLQELKVFDNDKICQHTIKNGSLWCCRDALVYKSYSPDAWKHACLVEPHQKSNHHHF